MTTLEVERKMRQTRQRYAAILSTNAGRKYSINYVDQYGIYHYEQGELNLPNAKRELAKRQAVKQGSF
jgi:hypothetical protein